MQIAIIVALHICNNFTICALTNRAHSPGSCWAVLRSEWYDIPRGSETFNEAAKEYSENEAKQLSQKSQKHRRVLALHLGGQSHPIPPITSQRNPNITCPFFRGKYRVMADPVPIPRG
jgi:hypothetical protein